jgi:ubiquinone/menaquinone biosynthesis C-methylase UbiE
MKILDLGGIKKTKESDDIVTDDESFDEVRIFHVLEHLKFPIKVMEEVWRILKPKGIVKIKVPYWKNFTTFENPFHLHEFKEEWFKNLTPSSGIYQCGGDASMEPFLPNLNFEVIKMRKLRGKFRLWKVYELEILLRKEEL